MAWAIALARLRLVCFAAGCGRCDDFLPRRPASGAIWTGRDAVSAAAPQAGRGRPLVIALVAIAAGLGFTWLAWQPIEEARRLQAGGIRVEARVPSVDEQRRRNVSTYYPIFVFRTREGRVVRERSAVAVAAPDRYLGQSVMVVYDPANTATVRSEDSLGAGDTPWIAGGLAVLSFVFAGFLLLAPRRPLSSP